MDKEREVHLSFQIDANRINSRSALENMNKLEKWHRDGVIMLEMSQVAQNEAASAPNSIRAEKAHGYVYSMTLANTQEEREVLKKIPNILFPGKANLTQNERNDVEIVFNAGKYCQVLVANDGGSKSQRGGILGNAAQLKRQLGITVMRDSEAVKLVESKISKRDERIRKLAARSGTPLPEWVGRD